MPLYVLDALIAQNVFGPGMGLPSLIQYRNLGTVRNKGVEANADVRIHRYVRAFANYSWQDKPKPKDFDISLINLPPEHRFNAGIGFDARRFLGGIDVQFADTAYWRDVLDRKIEFEEYVDTRFAEGAKPETAWKCQPGKARG